MVKYLIKKNYVLDKRYDTLNDNKDKNLDVTVVTPTQQAVEQAKQELTINSGKKLNLSKLVERGMRLRIKREKIRRKNKRKIEKRE